MTITVAICTWNRAALLDQTLAGLGALRVPAGVTWELLVVDNNSSDGTAAVLGRHEAAGNLPLRRLVETRQGHSNARNCALDHARGDWVLWTDDDVLADPDWLAGFAAAAGRHPAAGVIGGRIDPWFVAPPDPDLVAAFPALRVGFCGVDHGPAERTLGPTELVFGANMGFRAEAAAGLRFDPTLGRVGAGLMSGDDVDFQTRVRARGHAAVWAPGAGVRHYVDPARTTPEYLCAFSRELGRWDIRANGPPAGPRILGVPRWVVRAAAGARVAAAVAAARGRRAERYTHLQKYNYLRGIIRACRAREYPA